MCLDAGINLIDTANAYSVGLSEAMIGEVLAGRRDRALLATKVRMEMGADRRRRAVAPPRHLRLRGQPAPAATDYIDLYQVHEWDGQTPLEETLEALTAGPSGRSLHRRVQLLRWQLMKALGSPIARPAAFVSQQIYYSLQAREAEYELIPFASTRAWRPGLEPARRRPAVRQVPPGR